MADLLIGVDVGTTSTKAALYDPSGTLVADATWVTPLRWYGPDCCDQDPDDFYEATARTIRACLRAAEIDPGRVAGVAIAGQMAGVLGIDRDWRPSTPYDSWLDLTCSADVADLEREMGEEIVSRTGCPPMVNHAPKIRRLHREHPDVFARTAKFVMPGAYVAGRLAGLAAGDAFIDHTYLHFTGAVDAQRGAWSPQLLAGIGVPEDRMPRIVDPTTVVGTVTREGAVDTGLAPGTSIAAGLGDTAAGALGAGMVRSGQVLDSAGTAAVFAVSTDAFCPDTEERTLLLMRGAVEGQWIALAYLSGGSLLEWFQTALGHAAGGEEPVDLAGLTGGLEAIPPGSGGLLFLPYLDGRILPSNPSMRGAWVGLSRLHRREHLARAVLESVSYEYALYLDVARRLYPGLQPAEVRVVGGGARSAIWNAIKASALGMRYVRLDREELGCWGAALVAGKAVGVFPDLARAATETTRVRETFEPDPRSRGLYERMIEQYRASLAGLIGPSRALAGVQAEAWEERT